MDSSGSELKYVYKIFLSSTEIPLHIEEMPDRLPVSDIDQASGFVHLKFTCQRKHRSSVRTLFPHWYLTTHTQRKPRYLRWRLRRMLCTVRFTHPISSFSQVMDTLTATRLRRCRTWRKDKHRHIGLAKDRLRWLIPLFFKESQPGLFISGLILES